MIPVVNWSQDKSDRAAVVNAVGTAFRSSGFLVLQNPDVPSSLRAQVFDMADKFFNQPVSEKQKTSNSN